MSKKKKRNPLDGFAEYRPEDVTPILDLPLDGGAEPPKELVWEMGPSGEQREMLRNAEQRAPCGLRLAVEWQRGSSAPWAGKRLTMYCAEPNCLVNGGRCTGGRFVPHLDQFTKTPEDPRALRRKITPEEAVAGARFCHRKATGKDDPRTDKQIGRFIGERWMKMLSSLGRPGDWTQ